MHKQVKEYLGKGDIRGLRYVFLDSLDVDPTFEDYQEDYDNCKKVSGFFDEHQELTPVADRSQWNNDYWQRLKRDLEKNFSRERFEHMKAVAMVVYADKAARLLNERKKKASGSSSVKLDTVKGAEAGSSHSTASSVDEANAAAERQMKADEDRIKRRKEEERVKEKQAKEHQNNATAGSGYGHSSQTYSDRNVKKNQTNNAGSLHLGMIVGGVVLLIAAIVILGRS